MTAKEYYKTTGFVDSDDPMNLTDNLTLSRGTLFQLMEGYAASKQIKLPTDGEMDAEFRDIFSHALLGIEESLSPLVLEMNPDALAGYEDEDALIRHCWNVGCNGAVEYVKKLMNKE